MALQKAVMRNNLTSSYKVSVIGNRYCDYSKVVKKCNQTGDIIIPNLELLSLASGTHMKLRFFDFK